MFKPFQFTFKPPKTVPSPVDVTVPASSTASTPAAANTQQSRAGQLIAQLNDLVDTAGFLQDVVLARTGSMGVEIDPSVDPTTSRYLEQTYSVDQAPGFVTTKMYNHLLNAELGYISLESALGNDKKAEADGFELAARAWINNTVENHLINAGDFNSQVPLLLRGLKGDQIIFQSWQQQLQQYPAYSAKNSNPLEDATPPGNIILPIKNTDVSDPVYQNLTSTINGYSSMYASTFQLLSGVGVVESDVLTVLNAYITTPVEDLIRAVAIFQGLRGLVHKYRMKDVMDSLSAFAFIRMAADVGQLQFQLDRYATIAVNPMKTLVSKMGRILGAVRGAVFDVNRGVAAVKSVTSSGQASSGALKGISQLYSCGLPHNANIKKANVVSIPGLDNLTSGLAALGSHLDWGIREINSKTDKISESFRKLAARRLQDRAAQLDLLCSTQALDTLTNLAKAIIAGHQKGTFKSSQNPNQQVEAVSQILTSLRTGSNSTLAIQNGVVVATPPDVPTPPNNVNAVFQKGGLNRVSARSLQSLKGALS